MTKQEKVLIMQIAEKAEKMDLMQFDRLSLIMDLETAHEEFNLKLDELLNASDFDFAHDVVGIQQNIDRKERKMIRHFLPRYARGDK